MSGLTEAQEQAVVVRALRAKSVLFCAVPNGGLRSGRGGASLRSQGVKAGVPDLLIFDRPGWVPLSDLVAQHGVLWLLRRAAVQGSRRFLGLLTGNLTAPAGIALEMKRASGKPSDVRPDQREWLADLKARGWVVLVGYGADDALTKLRKAGLEV